MLVTLGEIKESRKGRKVYLPYARWVLHPTANYLALVAIKLGLSANQVSALAGIIGMVGCVLFAFGSYQMIIIGAFLIILYIVLDCMDGTVARVTKTVSNYGCFLDVALGYVLAGLIPLSVGVGIYLKTDIWLYLILGGFCAVSWLLGSAIILIHDAIFPSKLQTPGSSKLTKWRITLPEVPILIICAMLNYLEVYLVLFTAIFASRVIAIMYAVRKEAQQR